jgi:hypothetical protein
MRKIVSGEPSPRLSCPAPEVGTWRWVAQEMGLSHSPGHLSLGASHDDDNDERGGDVSGDAAEGH